MSETRAHRNAYREAAVNAIVMLALLVGLMLVLFWWWMPA